MVRGDGEDGQELTSEECVRAGMYWFGRSDFAAAHAWWQRALEIDPTNTRAQECLRLLSKSSTTGLSIPPSDKPAIERRPESLAHPLTGDLDFTSEASSEDFGVLTAGDDGEPSTPMIAPPLDEPAMAVERSGVDLPEFEPAAFVLAPSGDLKTPTDPRDPRGSRDLPPPGNMPHGNAFPFYDDPDPTPPQPTDAFDFAATGQSRSSSARVPARPAVSSSQISPWDDGPSRTSVLTLDEEEDGYDAVPDPTPLPNIDRERFFGRSEPETEQEIMDYLRATGDLPAGESAPAVSEPPAVAEPPPSVSPPVGPREDGPGILFDEPVEFEGSQDLGSAPLETPQGCLAEGQRRFQLHDFDGAIKALESIPSEAPEAAEARNLIANSRRQLLKMYESKIGDFEQVPQVLISNEQVIWLNLNHRAGFILSQIDGSVSYEDIISLSGMPRLDTVRILSQLLADRVIGVD